LSVKLPFNTSGIIDVGIEIVPVKEFAEQMSTGVSYFEQIVWDLEHRGSSEIDIPVELIIEFRTGVLYWVLDNFYLLTTTE